MGIAGALQRRSALFVAAVLAVASLSVPLASTSHHRAHLDPALSGLTGSVNVIVQSTDSRAAEKAVRLAGGHVTRDLWIAHGFAATVPASSIAKLAAATTVSGISLDAPVHAFGAPDPSQLQSVYPKAVNADKMWNAGSTGSGVTVALVDTGVANVPDLAGRIVSVQNGFQTDSCKNFSGESNCNDSYGHGTFIAGIIASSGASSNGAYTGTAPSAKILSVKVAGASGATDVSNVLAAIQWVVSYKNTYGIKVLNLSLGTDGVQTYRTDPFNYAVERAWDAGIVVVVSAGNAGPGAQTISKPADDPLVITVGAVDDQGTPGVGNDVLPNFSSRGPTSADGLTKPDVVAPGAHIPSLRAPGSVIDQQFPTYIDGNYRRGSGTSMAAGVVSGSVALLLQSQPSWTPDRIKYALTSTAHGVASDDPNDVGSGEIDVSAAKNAGAGLANQGIQRSNGMGSLDASRGSVTVMTDDPYNTVLGGLMTGQLLLFSSLNYTLGSWSPLGWSLSQWAGNQWYGNQWTGNQWTGNQWTGNQWSGNQWTGTQWTGNQWYGNQWSGNQWYGNQWSGSVWYGSWE